MESTQTNSTDRVVTIEKLVYGGDGLARDDRQVILAPLVLPEETARIHITEKKSQLLRGRVDGIVNASPHRVTAPCPYFGVCGGCHYQHAAYEYQLAQKVEILREVLTRVGKLQPLESIPVVSGPPFGYRNRAQLHHAGHRIGYHKAGSHELQPIDECLIISPRLQEALNALRRMVKDRRFPGFVRTLEIFTNETEVQLNVLSTGQPVARRFFDWCEQEVPGYTSGSLNYQAAGFDFRVSYGVFFQGNRFLLDALVEEALRDAEGETAIDLYSGAGLFTLPLAKRFASVTAVESGLSASRDLQHNAERAGLAVSALQTSAEQFLSANPAPADFVLADPPRSGLGKQAVRALLEHKPRRLTIVSCDPSTLARDLAALLEAYTLDSMTMIDLFPQTYHLETIARLRIKA